ncbi:MAG TPA: hypothetical protein GX709_02315 [Clostridiales bacterium]|nr:hypothetical protein [Clostridiales bacterium]
MARGRGCLVGVLGGSVLRGLLKFFGFIFKAIGNILFFTGLWIPGIYALVGVILKLTGTFDPLADSLGASLYRAGFWITVALAVIITFKNIFAPSKKRKRKKELQKELKREKKEKAKKSSYTESSEAEHVGFEQPPAPLDNYPTKLSRKERRQIKKISKEAKEDATFSDPEMQKPTEHIGENVDPNGPIYVATIQNGKVVYTPIVNLQPQQMPFNPNAQSHPQQMPFDPNAQSHPQQMPFGPNTQSYPQQVPFDSNAQQHPQQMPFGPNTQSYPQQVPFDSNVQQHPQQAPINSNVQQQMASDEQSTPYQSKDKQYTQNNVNNKGKDSKDEEPLIYLSKVESDTLIHEYEDRYEVYKMKDGKAIKDRVEYKRDFS